MAKTTVLPLKPNVPSNNLCDYKICIAGAKKVGKTQLANCFPNSFTMNFERGNCNHLPIRFIDCIDIKTTEDTIELLENKPGYASTIVVDNPQILYEMICADVMNLMNTDDLSNLSHGKGWGEAGRRFRSYMYRIQSVCKSTIYTCHYWPEIATHGERKERIYNCNFGRAVNKFIDETVHMWWLYEFDLKGEERMLKLKGTNDKKGGSGLLDKHFKKSDHRKGIPMGNDPTKLYEKLMFEFNNHEVVEEIIETV